MIPAVILAAGKSTRMGRPKALLALPGGDTFLTRIIRTFEDAGVDDVVVVIGHEAEAVAASVAAHGLAPRMVVNRQYESGQFSSFLAGLRAIDRPGVQALLFTLVDVPLVSSTTVKAVIDRYRASHAPIVRPVSAVRSDLHGHPVLMDRTLFDALRGADPSQGAKPIVRAHASPQGDVISDDEGAFLDIDTPEDYDRVRRESLG
jgi:molybdenum cofactor cytidylyltransferase